MTEQTTEHREAATIKAEITCRQTEASDIADSIAFLRAELARARAAEIATMSPSRQRRIYWTERLMTERSLTPANVRDLCGLERSAGPQSIRDLRAGNRLSEPAMELISAGLEVDIAYWVQPIPEGEEPEDKPLVTSRTRVNKGHYLVTLDSGLEVDVCRDTLLGAATKWQWSPVVKRAQRHEHRRWEVGLASMTAAIEDLVDHRGVLPD